jgi:hypothetical protein
VKPVARRKNRKVMGFAALYYVAHEGG